MQKVSNLFEAKAAIFDMDGTLTDSAGMWLDSRVAFFQEYGLNGTPEHIHQMIHLPVVAASQYAIDTFGLKASLDEVIQFWRDYAGRRYSTDIELKPGVKTFFEKLKSDGVPICLATGCTLDLAHMVLDRHGVGQLLDYEICVDEIGGDKSSPDIYLQCARKFGLTPGNCVVFEDCLPGIKAAYGAGFYTVAIQDHHSPYPLNDYKDSYDMVIENFEKLI